MAQFGRKLEATRTPIPGMLLFDLPVHGDNRGWFKENWQRDKMMALGLPDFAPVQNNISFNLEVGTTRGFHAEPWDKYVSVATGKVFGAWVDLRQGPSFGAVFFAEVDSTRAVFIPRGVANSFQTLESDTTYTYLVNDHWSAEAQTQYTFLNLADETVAIPWPIAVSEARLSERDKVHPRLDDVVPMKGKGTLILGANGQVGRALLREFPGALALTRVEFDVTDPAAYAAFDWGLYDTVINAAGYTAVDVAETRDGRRDCWATNVTAVSLLARVALENHLTLVHISSDYVFDGEIEEHTEEEELSPLGVYGQSKAAADAIVATVSKHYIVRTSWVIGDGNNFVKTMASFAGRGISPTVVNDQFGRLSFTDDIAAGIKWLLEVKAAPGTYNLSNDGDVSSWAEVASHVYALLGKKHLSVTGISTAQYSATENRAPRPRHSALSLDKLRATGFRPRNAREALAKYLVGLG
jgi:dTDP-4-dehydrorhamnose reductase/dTDP-4-dehydrorhamnose 3,5-epimerase